MNVSRRTFSFLATAAFVGGCSRNTPEPSQAKSGQTQKEKNAMNAVVLYFSATGATRAKAKALARLAKAPIVEILPEKPYTDADLDWHDKKSRTTIEMDDKSSRPAIKGKVENIGSYDVVFLGFPIWWYIAPTLINTFLEAHNLEGKTIVPFFTSGGSGAGKTLDYLKPSAPKSTFLTPKNLTGASDEEIAAWLASLNLPER